MKSIITEIVNINCFPLVDRYNQGEADPHHSEKLFVIGDMHGSTKKFLYFLTKHNIFGLIPKDYYDFCRISAIPAENVTAEDLDVFDGILKNANKTKDPSARAIIIGDEVADRNGNDFYTLKLITQLADDQIKFEILLSNHGIELVLAYERILKGEDTKFTRKYLAGDVFTQSMLNLETLIENGVVKRDEVLQLIKEEYLPKIKLLSYSLSHDGSSIDLFSHAPLPYGIHTIRGLAAELGVSFNDETAAELAATIDRINEKFQQEYVQKNRVSELHIDRMQYPDKHSFFDDIIWNRDCSYKRPNTHKGYCVNYINGHHFDDTVNERHSIQLDNNLAKSPHLETGEYTVYSHNKSFDHNDTQDQFYTPQEIAKNKLEKFLQKTPIKYKEGVLEAYHSIEDKESVIVQLEFLISRLARYHFLTNDMLLDLLIHNKNVTNLCKSMADLLLYVNKSENFIPVFHFIIKNSEIAQELTSVIIQLSKNNINLTQNILELFVYLIRQKTLVDDNFSLFFSSKQLIALIDFLEKASLLIGINQTFLNAILDNQDVAPQLFNAILRLLELNIPVDDETLNLFANLLRNKTLTEKNYEQFLLNENLQNIIEFLEQIGSYENIAVDEELLDAVLQHQDILDQLCPFVLGLLMREVPFNEDTLILFANMVRNQILTPEAGKELYSNTNLNEIVWFLENMVDHVTVSRELLEFTAENAEENPDNLEAIFALFAHFHSSSAIYAEETEQESNLINFLSMLKTIIDQEDNHVFLKQLNDMNDVYPLFYVLMKLYENNELDEKSLKLISQKIHLMSDVKDYLIKNKKSVLSRDLLSLILFKIEVKPVSNDKVYGKKNNFLVTNKTSVSITILSITSDSKTEKQELKKT